VKTPTYFSARQVPDNFSFRVPTAAPFSNPFMPELPCYHRLSAVATPTPSRHVIFNADDFGVTRGVNDGIIRAHRDGVLSSATLMATGAAFDDAVAQAKLNSSLGIGCHLVLVGEKSLSDAAAIPTLVDSRGNLPSSLPWFVAKVTAGHIRSEDIVTELRAQIQRICAAGIEPTHVDTHKHTHSHPRVMELVCRVANEFGINRIRKPIESWSDSWRSTRSGGKRTATQLVAASAVRVIGPRFQAIAKNYGMHSPGYFKGLAATGQIDAATLLFFIDSLETGTTEVMLHPGIYDLELAQTGTRLRIHRETEMNALIDPRVRAALLERGVRIMSYRELH
jgi:hopanoid biosynthesis associated protein HpnK